LGKRAQEAAGSTTSIEYNAARSLETPLMKGRNKVRVQATEPPHLMLYRSELVVLNRPHCDASGEKAQVHVWKHRWAAIRKHR